MNSPQHPPRPKDPRRPAPPDGAFDTAKLVTAADLLAALRKGESQDQPLEIGLGELKAPCRLLNAAEELRIVVTATQRARQGNITGEKLEISISYAVMSDILTAACTVNGHSLPQGFLEMLSAKELSALYDQYTDLNYVVNPNLPELTTEEIGELIDGVKKKNVNPKNLFSYQLRAVGKYFLDVIIPSLQMVKERGSP